MINQLNDDLISRIGDFCSVDERKKCREAALLFSPISNNYTHSGWDFNGPITDLNHKFGALLKVKPRLKTMSINIMSTASLLNIDDFVDMIKCFKDIDVFLTLNIYRNHAIFFRCIEAGLYVSYCDFCEATQESLNKLFSSTKNSTTINHVVIDTSVNNINVDITNIKHIRQLSVIDPIV